MRKLLSQSAYWVINKDLCSKLGLEATLLLTHLIECADQLDQPFYQQRDRILNHLGWTEYQYKKSLSILKEKELVSAEVKGIPPKNYWTINEEKLMDLLDIRVNITHPKTGEYHPTKKRNIKKEIKHTSIQKNHSQASFELQVLFDKFGVKKSKQSPLFNLWNELSDEEKGFAFENYEEYLGWAVQLNKPYSLEWYLSEKKWQKDWIIPTNTQSQPKDKVEWYNGHQLINGKDKFGFTKEDLNSIKITL